MKRPALCALACASSLGFGVSAAQATVILDVGAGDIQPNENLLFNNNPPPGLEVLGITNQTGTLVAIDGGEVLLGNGGQARIEAQDGLISSTFTYNGAVAQNLGFDFVDPNLGFTETEFRVFVGGGTATTATLTFVDTEGELFTQTFGIPSNGFFNAIAMDGQVIDFFSLAFNGSVQDIRQIRIGGVTDLTVVPEPATWAMMVLGFGSAGVLFRRRRALCRPVSEACLPL